MSRDTARSDDTACMAALPLSGGGDVPEWVHLVPARSGAVQTADRRGPYIVEDAEAIIRASFAEADELQIDENHAQDLAAGMGLPSPARGWITEMQARDDGIWGRVRWSEAGRSLVADRAYRAMSPVITFDKARRITRILRASLVNRPNFRGLAALNQETDRMNTQRLLEALGLPGDASEEQALAAIDRLRAPQEAMQSAMTELATVFGLEGAAPSAVLAAARLARAGTAETVALQARVSELQAEIDGLRTAERRQASATFVDAALAEGRAGVRQDNRDELIALHMEQPGAVEKLIGGLPKLDATRAHTQPPVRDDDGVALNQAQSEAAKLLGLDAETYRRTLASERNKETN
ncbi:MAG: phage protease [Pseudomonadota bacterium]